MRENVMDKMTERGSASVLEKGVNCWDVSQASFATPLIDADNFYTALYHAIVAAKHCMFVVGWDADSRIPLLRGEAAEKCSTPTIFSELIAWKAEQNPDFRVYILRWDSSFAFMQIREPWALEVWEEATPENVYIHLDDTIPMGGSQHQKVIVVDDVLAFSGGMDVSTNRWDTRDHLPDNPLRNGPRGEFVPLHDVQSMLAGPVVGLYSELVRWRWNRSAPNECIGRRQVELNSGELPDVWPQQFEPLFYDIPCAPARTIPEMDDHPAINEVQEMYLSLIASAEEFIYIENQFTTRIDIAEALNRRLKECADLKVLIVSSEAPKNVFECEGYWSGRIDFKRVLEEGIAPGRVQMSCSVNHGADGTRTSKRFHSKVMCIDDQFAVIGSSNISNRSMSLDTELDTIFAAKTDSHRQAIALFRNDLIAEHCGKSIAQVHEAVNSDHALEALSDGDVKGGYRLEEVNDEKFTDKSWQPLFNNLSDPEEPLVPSVQGLDGKAHIVTNPKRRTILVSLGILVVALVAGGIYWLSQEITWMNPDHVEQMLEDSQGTWWALPLVCLLYVIGGYLFFPVTVLSLAVAAVFGPLWGPLYGICGALMSAAALFVTGRFFGDRGLRTFAGPKFKAIDEKVKDSGVVGIAAIRLIPVAPYSLVNLVAGVSTISLTTFLAGTFLGMFPPMIAKGLVGDSLTQIFLNPSWQSISYLLGGILLWVVMIIASQKLVRYYQAKKERGVEEQSEPTKGAKVAAQ